jgi:hypothetical protein
MRGGLMMTVYDPLIIQKFADRLYRRATIVVIASTVFGVLGGGAVGLVLCLSAISSSLGQGDSTTFTGLAVGLIGGLLAAAILGLMGYLGGRERAFRLKLQAQTVLCQLKIEENTRRPQIPVPPSY